MRHLLMAFFLLPFGAFCTAAQQACTDAVSCNGVGTAAYQAGRSAEALQAFHTLCRLEGIIPALESSHAVAHAIKLAPTLPKDKILLVNLSGRGDKDMHTVAEKSGITF